MDEAKKEQIKKNTLELLELKKINSNKLFLESIDFFKLSKRRSCFLLLVFVVILVFLKFLLFNVTSAIDIISSLTVNINTIIIPIFAIVITGYAIFQALANGQTMITLITVRHGEESSKFKIYNLYFFGIGICYLILIITNFLLMIFFNDLPRDWHLPYLSQRLSELISATLISFYIVLVLNFLIEVKSFIYNLFQVFITNASSNAISFLEELDKKQK
jgi:hypothetical protein